MSSSSHDGDIAQSFKGLNSLGMDVVVLGTPNKGQQENQLVLIAVFQHHSVNRYFYPRVSLTSFN